MSAPAPVVSADVAKASEHSVEVVFYRYRFGAPPYRGMKFSEARLFEVDTKTWSTSQLISELRAFLSVSHSNVGFYTIPAESKLPEDFESRESTDVKPLAADRKLVYDVVGPSRRVVVTVGSEPGVCDIGVFVTGDEVGNPGAAVPLSAHNTPGVEWLVKPCLPTPLPYSVDVTRVAVCVSGGICNTTPADVGVDDRVVIPQAVCDTLITMIDDKWSQCDRLGSYNATIVDTASSAGFTSDSLVQSVAHGCRKDDFKLILSPTDALGVIGSQAYAHMAHELGGDPTLFALRRTVATGRWIGFHTDRARRTVQVPLSDDSECVGGRLVFACGSGDLVQVSRVRGAMLSHSGHVVHGVTQLLCGVRYGLFAMV